MSKKCPFNKDVILSQPIECENDLADVIVEMRKAIGFLLEENKALKDHVEIMSREMIKAQAYPSHNPLKGIVSPTMPSSLPSPWSRIAPGSALRTPSPMTAKEVSERIDMLVSPPIVYKTEGDL